MSDRRRPRIGAVVLPEYGWERTRRIWTGLEEMGLDHGWTFDHHSWRTLRDGPWYDALTVLTAVACVTRRMRIGTLVSSPNFRHPVVLAKQAMTLDQVSDGRFVLGVGAGATGADALLLGRHGSAQGRRTDRFAEFLEVLDLLLKNSVVTHRGEFFEAVDARMVPGCVQRPRLPFAVAAAGPRGLGLAARYADWWVTIGDVRRPGERSEEESWRLLRRQLSGLTESCERQGRDVGAIGRLVNVSRIVDAPYASVERFLDVVGRCQDLGITDVVANHPRSAGVFAGDQAAFERAVLAALAPS